MAKSASSSQARANLQHLSNCASTILNLLRSWLPGTKDHSSGTLVRTADRTGVDTNNRKALAKFKKSRREKQKKKREKNKASRFALAPAVPATASAPRALHGCFKACPKFMAREVVASHAEAAVTCPLPGSRSGAVNKPRKSRTLTPHIRVPLNLPLGIQLRNAQGSFRGEAWLCRCRSRPTEPNSQTPWARSAGRLPWSWGVLNGTPGEHKLTTDYTRKQPSYVYIVLLDFEVGSHCRPSMGGMIYAPESCRSRPSVGAEGSPVGVCQKQVDWTDPTAVRIW